VSKKSSIKHNFDKSLQSKTITYPGWRPTQQTSTCGLAGPQRFSAAEGSFPSVFTRDQNKVKLESPVIGDSRRVRALFNLLMAVFFQRGLMLHSNLLSRRFPAFNAEQSISCILPTP
jgi:hypothetical protein